MKKISVVLSTYNGSKYLIPLLDSIKNQTMKPNEVIISDDCSKDNTVELINNYIKDFKLDNWKLKVNKRNLGWANNFNDLIFNNDADYIFPCDQDDIWDLNKIETMVNCMDNGGDPSAMLRLQKFSNGWCR